MTEEAQEARNKDFKKFREHHSRKCSRVKLNTDVFNIFLLSSDPFITSKRNLTKKNLSTLPKEAMKLLLPPSNHIINNDHGDDSEDSDDDDNDDDDSDDDNDHEDVSEDSDDEDHENEDDREESDN